MKVLKLSNGESSFITDDAEGLIYVLQDCDIENMEVGESYRISCEEMDSDEYHNLPEFDGF